MKTVVFDVVQAARNPRIIVSSAKGRSIILRQINEFASLHRLTRDKIVITVNEEDYSYEQVAKKFDYDPDGLAEFKIQVKADDKIIGKMIFKQDMIVTTNSSTDTKEWVYTKEQQMIDMLEHIEYETGIKMTEDELNNILNLDTNSGVRRELNKWTFCDTGIRGDVSSMISEYFIRKRWPTYGDNLSDEEFAYFLESIRSSAEGKGFACAN